MGRSTLAVCALVASGLLACLQPKLVPCGDRRCPERAICTAGGRCASPEEVAACEGLGDGAACATGLGRCEDGACVATGCGNGVVDPGEACDDSNRTSGDGCRGDCQKIEICGDAVVDDGEGCDDANANPADGCDACIPTTWRATAVVGGAASASTVELAYPSVVVADLRGNLYIADAYNNRIRRVDATGVITTVAGNGTSGSGGDGGVATSATLSFPSGVAVDGLGNLYIADTANHRIRRVDEIGIITTVAGTGIQGMNGDGAAATSARLDSPNGVAVDGLGNLYIADTANHRIRRVDTTGFITTVAGNGTIGATGDGGPATSAQLVAPVGVTLDGLDNFYIVDRNDHTVRRVDAATRFITRVAGTSAMSGFGGDLGGATSARLSSPVSCALDGAGNLYIADSANQRIRRVDTTGVITTIAGTGVPGPARDGGPAITAELATPFGVTVDVVGTIYIADTSNHRIRRIDSNGVITSVAGNGGGGAAATSVRLAFPHGVAADGVGNLYIADSGSQRIRRVGPDGAITTVAGFGTEGFTGDGGAATAAQLKNPYGIAFDGLGAMFIADRDNHRVRRVAPGGVITTVAGIGSPGFSGDTFQATGAQLSFPAGVASDGAGNLYIADSGNHRVRRVATTGVITTVAGTATPGYNGDGVAATSAQLNTPSGLAIDGLGRLYIADQANHRIRRVDASGMITTVAGTGLPGGFGGDGGLATSAQLNAPSGIAVDSLGNLYIADDRRVRRVDPGGVITTVAGNGVSGDNGDGGPATDARLSPTGIAVDSTGDLYVTDTLFQRIRHVRSTTGVITTVAGNVDPEGMGPVTRAHLAEPRALVLAGPFALVAGGTSGTVQAIRTASQWIEVVSGRYSQAFVTGALARFRDSSFGTISGVAFDAAAGQIYLTESSTNKLHVVTVVNPDDETTWTITAFANVAGIEGFAEGAAPSAQFRGATGLYFDAVTRQLYFADTGNHVIRAIDLTSGVASATVRTVAGTPATRGFFGDDGDASTALLFAPQAITRCANGDLFIADTGNHRVRRVAAATGAISTVLGDGVPASSGEGRPASTFPVHAPLGLACDAIGNLFVTSTTTVRMVPYGVNGTVDGTGGVQTIYGLPPRETFPQSVTNCLTGLAVVDATTVQIVDSCTGLLVELRRGPP